MRLRAEQFPACLERTGLPAICFVSGDEPMQHLEVEDAVRAYARAQGVEERVVVDMEDVRCKWQRFRDAVACRSLFATRRLIELRLGARKPGQEGASACCDYLAGECLDVLLISTARLDRAARRTKWFSALQKAVDRSGVWVEVWPIAPSELPCWIKDRARQFGKSIDDEGAALIAQQTEGNLLAVRQVINTLCLLVSAPRITAADVVGSVTDSARFDVFDLMESACAGDAGRVLRVLYGLRAEGTVPMALLGAMLWEIRRLCDAACQHQNGQAWPALFRRFNIWQKPRQMAFRRAAERCSPAFLHRLLLRAVHIERQVKSSHSGSVWDDVGLLLTGFAVHVRST